MTPTHVYTHVYTHTHTPTCAHLRPLEEVWEVGVGEVAHAPLDPDAVVAPGGRGEVLQPDGEKLHRRVPVLPCRHLAQVLFCRFQKMLHWFCQVDLTTSDSGFQIYHFFWIQGFELSGLATRCHLSPSPHGSSRGGGFE